MATVVALLGGLCPPAAQAEIVVDVECLPARALTMPSLSATVPATRFTQARSRLVLRVPDTTSLSAVSNVMRVDGVVVLVCESSSFAHVRVTGDGADQDVTFTAATGFVTPEVRLNGGNDRFAMSGGTAVVVAGGAGDDVLSTGSGTDTASGDDGDDTLVGGSGDDTLAGSAGNDLLQGLAGADTLDGGSGSDAISYAERTAGVIASLSGTVAEDTATAVEGIISGAGDDTLAGSAGPDVLRGGGGDDTLSGGGGDDLLEGGAGTDALVGGPGDDILEGQASADALDGGAGSDSASYAERASPVAVSLAGGAANEDGLVAIESLVGGAGDDALTGDGGPNALSGGGGDDVLDGGLGRDALDGGAGSDTASYAARTTPVAASLASPAAGEDALSRVERLAGGSGDDVLTGDDGANAVAGGDGHDQLDGGGGGDALDGGPGDDRLDGGAGDDRVSGADGADRLAGGGDDDALDGGAGDDRVSGADGADRLAGGGDDDALDGGAGDDLIGGDGALATAGARSTRQALVGTGGNDVLVGGDGSDAIDGGGGSDSLSGGGGADSLTGGDGADRLDGGSGADAFFGGSGDDRLLADDRARDARLDCGTGTDDARSDPIADDPVLRADCELRTILAASGRGGQRPQVRQSPNACIAGAGSRSWCGDDRPAHRAKLAGPSDVVVTPAGELLIADTLNNVIRRVSPPGGPRGGRIRTFAGTGERGRARTTNVRDATFDAPEGVAVGPTGIVFVADTGNDRIRAILPSGAVLNVPLRRRLTAPRDVVALRDGSILVANSARHEVLHVVAGGQARVLAGSGRRGAGGDGGPATRAGLNGPSQLAIAPDGALLVADRGNGRIRRIAADGRIDTLARGLRGPRGVVALPSGEVLAGTRSQIVAITPGRPPVRRAGQRRSGFNSDARPALSILLDGVGQLALGPRGKLVFTDGANDRIRELLDRLAANGAEVTSIRTTAGGNGDEPVKDQSQPLPGRIPAALRGADDHGDCRLDAVAFRTLYLRPRDRVALPADANPVVLRFATSRHATVVLELIGPQRVTRRRTIRTTAASFRLAGVRPGRYTVKLWAGSLPTSRRGESTLRCNIRTLRVARGR